jgi:hypothetical protein
MADPYVKTNKTKRYDIFKNTVNESDVRQIKQLLANLSVADTSHDIDKKDKGIPNITQNLREPNDFQAKMYKKGIPLEYNDIPSEEDSISSVIKKETFEWEKPAGSNPDFYHDAVFRSEEYVPKFIMKYIKEGKLPADVRLNRDTPNKASFIKQSGTKHKFSTKNDNKYVVTYFDVKPEKNGGKGDLIDAKKFFTDMNYETNANINIAFVVDCTSITIEDILNNGEQLGPNFKTYLIKSPEGENDPGGKTNLQDKSFKKYDTLRQGVRYKAAVPYNLKKTNSYNYSFQGINISPYTQFFTKYNFSLSELQFDDKYIFSALTTTLTIIDPENSVPAKPVLNSGDMNEIAAVSTLVRNIIAKIKKFGNKYSAIDTFDYNCALQQKRSGDWLQALLTCLVASGERKFCEYSSPEFSVGKLFKKKEIQDGATNTALDFEESNVYLVTHDRILLAFALLLGINVIFTHHFPGSRGYSYHSALVYKIENPLERAQSKIVVMQEFYDTAKNSGNGFYKQLDIAHNDLSSIYSEFNKHVNQFKCGKDKCLNEQRQPVEPAETENLEHNINRFRTRITQSNVTPITTNEINEYTQKIFSFAFKIALIKSTFPDLDNLNTDLTEIQTLRDKFDGNSAREPYPMITNPNSITVKLHDSFDNSKNPQVLTANEPDTNYFLKYKTYSQVNNGDAYKVKYEDIVKYLSQYHSLIKRAEKFKKIKQDNFSTFITSLNGHLKKNPTFGLILAWRTTNAPKFNLWVQYNNVLNPNWAFINDKNVFLYELTKLDDDSKDKICRVYLDLFNAIKIPANISGPASLQAKTQQNVLSFCLEVFINLGPFVTDNTKNRDIKTAIDTYLARENILPEPASPDVRNISTVPIDDFKPERFKKVIEELNALNATKSVQNGNGAIINVVDINTPRLNNAAPPSDPLKIYEPLVTPIVIEELIEINVKKDQAIAAAQKDKQTNISEEGTKYSLNTDNAPPDFPPVVEGDLLQIVEGNFEQSGGRAKMSQDISFIFDNKMAPKYLAVTNLFAPRPVIHNYSNFDYILDRLSGASERMINELTPPNTDLTRQDLEDISRPLAPADLEQRYVNVLRGGSHEEIESLLSSEESILKNEKIASHPLLSIYLILESYCTELNVTYIEESWDYEYFVQFFVIANAMINNLLKIYSGDNKTNMNELKACMVGYGLRELIFTSPQYIERDPICTEALDIKIENYNPLSKMFSIFVNRVCGSVNQTPEDISLGSKYINNSIFKEYATRNEFNRIFDSNVGQVNTYELSLKAQNLFLAVGNKIISDTNGIENNTLLELTENNPLPLVSYLEEVPPAAVTPSSDVLVETTQPSGDVLIETTQSNQSLEQQSISGADILAARAARAARTASKDTSSSSSIKQEKLTPFKEKIMSSSELQKRDNKPILGNVVLNTPSSSSTSTSQGGKKTKKNKKYLKNKLTKGKARKYKNRTKKHRTIKYKLNKKLNKRSKRNRKYN